MIFELLVCTLHVSATPVCFPEYFTTLKTCQERADVYNNMQDPIVAYCGREFFGEEEKPDKKDKIIPVFVKRAYV